MRFVLVQNMPWTGSFGGAAKANAALLRFLHRQGHSCDLVALPIDGAAPEESPYCIHTAPSGRALMRLTATQLAWIQPDWVLVSSQDPGHYLLQTVLESCGRNVALLVHAPRDLPFGPSALIPANKGAELIRRCRLILTVSDYMRDYIR